MDINNGDLVSLVYQDKPDGVYRAGQPLDLSHLQRLGFVEGRMYRVEKIMLNAPPNDERVRLVCNRKMKKIKQGRAKMQSTAYMRVILPKGSVVIYDRDIAAVMHAASAAIAKGIK